MKRYKWTHLFGVFYKGYSGEAGYLKDDPDGEWMKREDVEGILQYKDQLKGYKLESARLKFPKCNCEENAYAGLKPDGSGIARSIFWICPAHGYKRR